MLVRQDTSAVIGRDVSEGHLPLAWLGPTNPIDHILFKMDASSEKRKACSISSGERSE